MAFSRPLAVAIAAAVLLVLVVGADASMDRSLHVDRRSADGAWATLASAGEVPPEERYAPFPMGPWRVAGNESLTLRVRVENGYPWAYSEAFVAYVDGVEVARGRVEAEPRGTGTAEFEVPVERVAGRSERSPPGEPAMLHGTVEVRVGRTSLHAGIPLEVGS
ncbi:MAG TPA: hypothetical protein VNX21_09320 [Candidatus Thermoplasmatota archaeon]|nr:hypothetical protein [Candidatus Thermoplasmatota archaeon]